MRSFRVCETLAVKSAAKIIFAGLDSHYEFFKILEIHFDFA